MDGRCGGGVCMYLRNNINYHIWHDLSDNQLECLVIKIARLHCRPFLVSTRYRPPSSSQDSFSRGLTIDNWLSWSNHVNK